MQHLWGNPEQRRHLQDSTGRARRGVSNSGSDTPLQKSEIRSCVRPPTPPQLKDSLLTTPQHTDVSPPPHPGASFPFKADPGSLQSCTTAQTSGCGGRSLEGVCILSLPSSLHPKDGVPISHPRTLGLHNFRFLPGIYHQVCNKLWRVGEALHIPTFLSFICICTH